MPESVPVFCPRCHSFVAEVDRVPDRELHLDCPQGHAVRVTVRAGAVTWEPVTEPEVQECR